MYKRSCKLIVAAVLAATLPAAWSADPVPAAARPGPPARRRPPRPPPRVPPGLQQASIDAINAALASPGAASAPVVAAATSASAPASSASAPSMVSAALTPGAPASAPVAGTLDGRIQDVKADVIKLNRDLLVLEEELLFPANTQVALFVSMDVGKMFQLDSVQIKLDDKVVANYLYTALEVEALHRGGVQRVYLGNLKTGQHEIVAFFTGKGPQRARLPARRERQVREDHRGEVHRAAHPGFDRQAAARVRRQALAVTDNATSPALSASHRSHRRCGGGVRARRAAGARCRVAVQR